MILTKAPLRVPLGGGGTDFPSYYLKYGGLIVGFALDKYVHVVLHDTIDEKIRLKYSKTECVDHLDDLENRVAAEALKWYGVTKGVEVATFSDVPESSGLGGSSAFCVALVAALRKKVGMSLDKYQIMASAYDIERNKAGQPGGMQDQFFASLGGAWCLELGKTFISRELDVSDLLPRLKLVYTNTGRADLGIAERQIVGTSKGDLVGNLDSIKRLCRLIEPAIQFGKVDTLGALFDEHWCVKKARDSEVSNPEVDRLYEESKRNGATGGKLIGLGGGGYLLLYTPNGLRNMEYLSVGLDTEGVRVVYES